MARCRGLPSTARALSRGGASLPQRARAQEGINAIFKTLLASTALIAALGATPASASTVFTSFAGTFDNDGTAANDDRDFTADVQLDVENGMAQSGTGSFFFQGITHSFALVTVNTPDNHNIDPNYPVGLKSNGGDNVFGADQIYPLTSIGGLLFALDTNAPADFEDVLLNFYNNNGTLAVGAYGYLNPDVRLYTGGSLTQTSEVVVDTPAVPEPATWGMMILGIGAVGYAMRRRRVAFAATGAATA